MTPDDPRHGTSAGCTQHYRDSEKPCAPCLAANRRATITQRLHPPKRPALGSQRRLRALQAIGYSRVRIARELGYSGDGSFNRVLQSKTILAVTEQRISEVYDRLSMVIPNGPGATRARNWAARNGHLPPLAWEDIDDPNDEPSEGYKPVGPSFDERGNFAASTPEPMDEVAVVRILNGDWRLSCSPAEKAGVVARWTGTHNELARLTGWKVERYTDRQDGAA